MNEKFWWEEEGTYYLGSQRPQGTDPERRLERRPPAPVGDRPAGARRSRRATADGRRHVVGLGRPDAVVRPPGVQPVLLPDRLGVAARQRDRSPAGSAATGTRPRRPRSRRASSTPPNGSSAMRLPELFSGLPRVPASFPVPYLGANVPAGMGGRLGLPVRGDPVRAPRDGRRRRVPALRQPGTPGLAARDHDPEPAARRPARWRSISRTATSRCSRTRPATGSCTDLRPGHSAVAARSWQSHRMQAPDDPAVVKAPWGPEVDGRRLLNEAVGFGRALRAAGLAHRPRRRGRLRAGPAARRHRLARAGPGRRRDRVRPPTRRPRGIRHRLRPLVACPRPSPRRLPGTAPPAPGWHRVGGRRPDRRGQARAGRRANLDAPRRMGRADPDRPATTMTRSARTSTASWSRPTPTRAARC